MVSQLPSTDADQAHSRVALTLSAPAPPDAGTVEPPPLSVMPQRGTVAGAVVVDADEPQLDRNADASRIERRCDGETIRDISSQWLSRIEAMRPVFKIHSCDR